MTLLEKINNLTWFDLINKLKSILKDFYSSTTGIPEAPINGQLYGRKNADWEVINSGGGSVTIDATPIDGSSNAVSSNGVFDALATKQNTLTAGTNITLVANVVDVDIPPIVNVSAILGTTGSNPRGITIDNLGNIYTANISSDNVSKITPAGVSTILGTTDSNPTGIAIDEFGNIYTANYSSNNVSKITPAGVSTILGTTDVNPRGIAIDEFGNIYTANISSDNVTKITPAGVSTILGTTGSNPRAITIDSLGNVYTANTSSDNVSKITPAGVSTILGTTGSSPYAITIDEFGNIYTANFGSDNVTKITPAGVSTILGTTDSNPTGIAIDEFGNIYTANYSSNNVSKITPAGVSTILGTTDVNPRGIAIDEFGNIYTANISSDNVTKITPAGVSTILGTTGSNPQGITIDSLGNIYTANISSDNVTKITPAGVSNILGTTGSAPTGILIDNLGNVYTANFGSDNVTKITPDNKRILAVDEQLNIIRVDAPSGGGGTKITENNTVQNSVATTLEQIIHVLEIPANFATENDMFEFFSVLNRPISTGNATMRCYVNSVNSLSGASLIFNSGFIALNSISTTNRRFLFKGGFFKGVGANNSVTALSQASIGDFVNYNFNATIPQYFITTVQLTATDTAEAFYSSLTKIN